MLICMVVREGLFVKELHSRQSERKHEGPEARGWEVSYRRKKTRLEKEDMSEEVLRHGCGSYDVGHR